MIKMKTRLQLQFVQKTEHYVRRDTTMSANIHISLYKAYI